MREEKPASATPNTTIPKPPTSRDEASSTATPRTLPSTTDNRRSEISKRLTRLTDTVLARASIAGQHINEYTGTDYSGIETIRSEIAAQEESMRSKHGLVDTARTTYQEAHTRQGAAQKEIVSLLERKSSWSPTDLERYMSLVRSEHSNDQAVQAANEGLAAAERDLESARSLLERLERKRYHEEQIWSDTIRRNSTWVTFGLMGFNIILLLAQIVSQIAIIEPRRRKKIVGDVERLIEEKVVLPHRGPVPGATAEAMRMVDEVVEPAGVAIEAIEAIEHGPQSAAVVEEETANREVRIDDTPLAAGELLPQKATDFSPSPPPPLSARTQRIDTWATTWDSYVEGFQDLFSERIVQLKKVDVTTTALQGAATGVAAMGLLFVLFRPR